MKRLITVLCTIFLFSLAVPSASPATIGFAEGYLNYNGDLFEIGAFDVGTTLTFFIGAGNPGDYFVGVFLDYEIDEPINTFFNEYGDVTIIGPPAGLSWEIDEPGFVFGDIYTNFAASDETGSLLDNSNAIPSATPDDVSMALGWNFVLGATDTATIRFSVTDVQPAGFHLAQFDPDSDYAIYLSSSLRFNEGGPDIIPEPGTWVLLLTGLTMIGATAKRFGKRS